MNRSQTIAELAKALVQVQEKMPSVPMDGINPFFNNSPYATLGSVIETSKPLLAGNGLSITQFPTSSYVDGVALAGVTTLLLHTSGEYIEDTIIIPLNEAYRAVQEQDNAKKKEVNFSQKSGIVITYLRRYAWLSVLGMYGDADEDGNTPSERKEISEAEVELRVLKGKIKATYDAVPIDLQDKFKTLWS